MSTADEFGFTNDATQLERVRQYVAAAVADGWEIQPTYASESVDRAARLKRDGFVMQALTRTHEPSQHRWLYEAKVHLWGPDGLALTPPEPYDFAEMLRRTRICSHCKAEDVETVRYGFAGRCCKPCLPEMRKRHEQPGWND